MAVSSLVSGTYTYRRLNPELTKAWAKKLVSDSSKSQLQKEFLEKLLEDGCTFADYVESSIGNEPGISGGAYADDGHNKEQPSLLVQSGPVVEFTPEHLYSMPPEDMLSFFKHLPLPIRDAESSFFWGAMTLRALRDGVIKPEWLATNTENETSDSIRYKVSHASAEDDPERVVRRVIRSLTAPGVYRGIPELYADCAFAKAWWCVNYSKMCHTIISNHHQSIAVVDIIAALTKVWREFAIWPSNTLVIFADPLIASGYALWAVEETKNKPLTIDKAKSARNALGEISARISLVMESPFSIMKMIGDRLTEVPTS